MMTWQYQFFYSTATLGFRREQFQGHWGKLTGSAARESLGSQSEPERPDMVAWTSSLHTPWAKVGGLLEPRT